MEDTGLYFKNKKIKSNLYMKENKLMKVVKKKSEIKNLLHDLNQAFYVIQLDDECIALAVNESMNECTDNLFDSYKCLGYIPDLDASSLGDADFINEYGLKYAYMAGAMANGISSEEMVIELGKNGFLGSFGSGGLSLDRIEMAIKKIQSFKGNIPYAFNLLHNPVNPAMEWDTVRLYLRYNIKVIEASAYLRLTPALVYYRVSGFGRGKDGMPLIRHKIIAKISRREVAKQFMEPAPESILKELYNKGYISNEQYEMAKNLPVADDITVEGDSGGHTDKNVLLCTFPEILELRNKIQLKYNYRKIIRVGAGGGISTPYAAMAAFSMGASYIVTGSINQATIESATSEKVKKLLQKAEVPDVMMTPAADMFESGVNVQVLKRGTLYPIRAQKLYEYYKKYNSIDEIPDKDIERLESQIFRKKIYEIWEETKAYFFERDIPQIIAKAENDPKVKMSLIFRWYLGQSPSWAIKGENGREADYQIWCGPSIGAFNELVKGSSLESIEKRKVAEIARILMTGAAYIMRIKLIEAYNVKVCFDYQKFDLEHAISKKINEIIF